MKLNGKLQFDFKAKVITLSAGIALALLLLILAPFVGGSAKSERENNQPIFENSFKVKLASSISLSKGNQSVHLKKQGDSWWVDYPNKPMPANEAQVETLLKSFKALTRGRLVDKKPKESEVYGLSEAGRSKIEITDSKSKTFLLFLGKENSTYTKQYYQLENSNRVYETPFPHLFSQFSNKEWADLHLFKGFSDDQSIAGLRVQLHSQNELTRDKALTYELVRLTDKDGNDSWNFKDSEEKTDRYEVDSLVRAFARASVYDYRLEDTLPQTGLDTPFLSLQVSSLNGTLRTVEIGNAVPDNERYWVRLKEEGVVAEAAKSTVESLLRSKTDLLIKE